MLQFINYQYLKTNRNSKPCCAGIAQTNTFKHPTQ